MPTMQTTEGQNGHGTMTGEPGPRMLTDIGLVAFLYALGERPVRIARSSPLRMEFYFAVPEALLLDYYQGRTRVEPRVLFQAMRDVKSLATQQF